MLHFAYDRKYPVQIVISANKEAVVSEKRMTAGFGQTIVVGYSEPVHSSQYPTFDRFAGKVQQEWDQQWKRVYSARLEGESRNLVLNLRLPCIFLSCNAVLCCAVLWYNLPAVL